MIQRIYAPFLIVLAGLFFTGCKKGEDDPSVSLRTRKNRLTGEWRMISGRAAYTAANMYNETYTFDGTKLRLNITSPGNPVVYLGSYILNLTIRKDGTFSVNEILGNLVFNAEGTWNFNTGVGEEKKKENAVFFVDQVNKGYTFGYHLFNRSATNFVYKIKELRNKKLVIYSAGKLYSHANGLYVDYSTEYTFIQ